MILSEILVGLDLNPIWSKEGPTTLIYFMDNIDYIECINPDGSRMSIPYNKIDEINEIVTKFRKEHGISDLL